MTRWLRRIRAAVVMGLIWAVGWGFIGGLMEIVDPHGRILDMWPQTLAIPGFLGGAVFSLVLWLAEGRRRFDELSLPRFTAWGAVAGVSLGGLVVGVAGVSSLFGAGVIIGLATLLSTGSAAGSLALARMGEKRELLDAGSE